MNRFTRILPRFFLVALLGVSLSPVTSCIKEKRDDCPCWLDIDFSHCTRFAPAFRCGGWVGEQSVFGATVYREQYGTLLTEEVPRGMVSYIAYSLPDKGYRQGSTIKYIDGYEADSLYAYRADVNTNGESAYDLVRPHKQFFTLTVTVADPSCSEMTLKADYNGLDLLGFGAVEGPYTCVLSPVAGYAGVWRCRVPRQGEAGAMSLSLRTNTGWEMGLIDLRDKLTESHYDWNAEDLDDIRLFIDWAHNDIIVTVQPWNDGDFHDVDVY